jgi:PAS domain S-box-containing protein
MFGIDRTGRCTLSLGRGLEDLGLRPGELVGQNLYTVYAADPRAVASLDRVLRGETFNVEREFDQRRLSIYFEPVRDPDGTVTGALGVATDVTEQRRIEAEVLASRARARLLADVSATLARAIPDIHALARVALRAVTEAVGEVGAIWVRTSGTDRLEPVAVWPDQATTRAPSPSVDPATVPGTPEPVTVDTTDGSEVPEAGLLRDLAEPCGPISALRVPLRSRGLLLGMVTVGRGPSQGGFDDDAVSLVSEVAERCAMALDTALLLDAERDAREELVKFQALADASADLITISDTEDRLTYVNPRLRESGAELERATIWDIVERHAGTSVMTAIHEGVESTGRWSGDIRALLSGQRVIVEGEIFRLSHPDTGAPLGTAWIGREVTELRATEAALREANSDLKQFKALVEASPDFIAIAALDGKVMYVNPPGRAMIGMEADVDVTTTSIPDYLTPEGLEASVNVEQPAVIANGHWEGQSTLRNRKGPPVPVAIASFLMHDAETGEPFALATVQRDISERLRADAALRELAQQREALLTRLVDAQEEERTQIAADIHDDPVQALAAVDLRLGSLRRRLRQHAPDLVELVEPLQASVSGATERLRTLLFDLEPPDLEHGLTGALRRAAEELFSTSATRWTIDGDREPDAPDATRAIAYRIVKEALTNVRKHAHAANVMVTVGTDEGGLTVTVEDDGVGVEPGSVEPSPGHRGVRSMQDRAVAAGGRCTIHDRRGGGTVVEVWLPGSTSAARPEG